MPDLVRVPIPKSDDPEDRPDLVAYFQDLTDEEFGSVLDLEVEELDDRAQVENISVKDVNADGDDVSITYELEFSAYYGCKDMDYSDTDERVVRGWCEGDHWVFSKHVATPRRYPNDEL